MNEQEFRHVSEAALNALEAALEASGADVDFEWQGDGVLVIDFADDSQMIINRHSSAQEIWVAAKAGGFHFRYVADGEAGVWLDTRDQTPLCVKVSALVSQQSGARVDLCS